MAGRNVARIAAVATTLAVVLAAVLVAKSGSPAPAFPDATSLGARHVAGVLYIDENGNGRVDDGDTAVDGAEVRAAFAGQNRQSLPSTSSTSNDDGSFVVRVPDEISSLEYFVEVSLPLTERADGEAIELWHRVELGAHRTAIAVERPEQCDQQLTQATAGACGVLLLPDLRPVIDGAQGGPDQPMPVDSWRVDDSTQPGRRLLRFASLAINQGAGPLHVIAANEPVDGRLPTRQRVWTSTFRWLDQPAGAFIHHPGHGHIHLDEFEQYRLLNRDGTVVAEGGKVSFCLRDSIRLPEYNLAGIAVRSALDCGTQAQAINPGFGDYYGASLDDQWIDITGVAPGTYLVEIVVDPANRLTESDETNNRVTFEVTLD